MGGDRPGPRPPVHDRYSVNGARDLYRTVVAQAGVDAERTRPIVAVLSRTGADCSRRGAAAGEGLPDDGTRGLPKELHTDLHPVFDRASRYLRLADSSEGHGADATLAALRELIDRIPEPLRLTLTWGPVPRDGPPPTPSSAGRHRHLLRGAALALAAAHQQGRQRAHPPLLREEHQPRSVDPRRPLRHRAPRIHHAPPKPALVDCRHRRR